MALAGKRTFVGLGFGAIQAGLFLYEAYRSEGFARLVAGEVDASAVDALRRQAGSYSVNIAHPDRVEAAQVGPVEIENPAVPADRARLVEAVAAAEEMATAVPSVRFYVSEGPGSIHRILAEGLRRKVAEGGPRAVIYAAENHNHAAEILMAAVFDEIPAGEQSKVRERVQFLNTVVGKMSGVVTGNSETHSRHLAAVTRDSTRAFLVEAFNRILVTKVHFPQHAGESPFERGIAAFIEKEDLLPFEEAKLYGHNATHAMAAYLCSVRGLEYIADLRRDPDLLGYVRDAFLKESGEALVRKHAGVDPLFTHAGYHDYAMDLLERMTNPFLQDSVERVGRDPQRKLGWDDRLVGTVRVALEQNLVPHRYATGTAAALATLDPAFLATDKSAGELLAPIWGTDIASSDEAATAVDLIDQSKLKLKRWIDSEFHQPLESEL